MSGLRKASRRVVSECAKSFFVDEAHNQSRGRRRHYGVQSSGIAHAIEERLGLPLQSRASLWQKAPTVAPCAVHRRRPKPSGQTLACVGQVAAYPARLLLEAVRVTPNSALQRGRQGQKTRSTGVSSGHGLRMTIRVVCKCF